MKPILRYTPLLRVELDSYLKAKLTQRPAGEWGDDFLERLSSFSGGGKLLRGSLLCFSYQLWSGRRRPSRRVIKAALAVELAHSALLIHDDIMDGDDLRRGQPAMHRQYRTIGQQRHLRDASGFGASMALCGGDITLTLAFELLAAVDSPALQQIFTEQLLRTCGGQMQDMHLGAASGNPGEQAIYEVMGQKTAGYTLALPLAMGAVLAGKGGPLIDRLRSIGMAAGVIFQIRDDELGALGDQKQTGKPVGADIRENKKTLLRYHLMKRCSDRERRRLTLIFGNPRATVADIRYAQGLLQSYEIPAQLAKAVGDLRRQAGQGIDRLPLKARGQRDFHELLDFCSQRQL
jgi:geranylgeranyl diphosphate synthase type I